MCKPGIIVVDKPINKSSAFISRLVGRIVGAEKVGHIGTLDPFATGVLPIVINEATRIIPYIRCNSKQYIFDVVFGKKTDSADCTGRVIDSSTIIPTKEQILSVLPKFIGKISQIPSSFSAIKVNGVRAYRLSRNGQNPVMPERIVDVFALDLLSQNSDNAFSFSAVVGPGTYIRTLCEDIASSLGTVAYVNLLRRVRDGKFSIHAAATVDDIQKTCYTAYDPEDVLDDIPVVFVGLDEKRRLLNGLQVEKVTCNGIVLAKKSDNYLAFVSAVDNVIRMKRVIKNF